MKIVNEQLLDEFRSRGHCELCGRPGTDPHHVRARGMGGAGRLDVRENLVTLCRRCHDRKHSEGFPLTSVLFAVVAAREGKSVDQLVEYLDALRRARP